MSDYLIHHGIKGQKWGVRRFQNKDGTRTAAGRKRESITRKKATVENAERLAMLARSREGTRSDEYRETLRKVAQGGTDEVFDATAKKTNAYLDGLAKEIETKYEPNLDEYCMYASVGSIRRREFTGDDKDVQKVFEAYRHDDADQGNENSYTYYMLANGVNPNKFHDNHFKKLSAMRAESKRVARDLLGDHADDVIHRYGDWKWTAGDQVAVDLQNLATNDKYYRYEPYTRDDGYKYSAAEIQAMKDDIKYARENGLIRVKHSDARQNYLMHHGIKGQKWGVRRTPAQLGHDIATKRRAKKDAKEFARAKMFYGEGAGNRRKLIKATVNERSKDPRYKEYFDSALAKQDMAKHAERARSERHTRDVAKTTTKTARGLINMATGNAARVSASAVAVYGLWQLAKRTGADRAMAEKVRSAYKDVKSGAAKRKAQWAGAEALRRMGMDIKW